MQQDSVIQPGASQWIGKPLRRLEDQKLLTGQGRFTDDVALPEITCKYFCPCKSR